MSDEKKEKQSKLHTESKIQNPVSANVIFSESKPITMTFDMNGKLISDDVLVSRNTPNQWGVGNVFSSVGANIAFGNTYYVPKSSQQEELESELATQRAEITKLRKEKKDALDAKKQIEKEREIQGKLIILNRISIEAHGAVLSSQALQDKFLKEAELHPCYIMSIDIRRSTELMLQASSEIAYKNFIRKLTEELKKIVLEYDGVFDKFTGDGILAFFPEFFSGKDAGVKAIAAAEACHEIFAVLYQLSEASFDVVPTDVGLGIGIDYGKTQIVTIEDSLTVVGKPVVYACRLGAAPAGTTLLNPNAYRAVTAQTSTACNFSTVSLEIKRDKIKAYAARLSNPPYKKDLPGWAAFLPVKVKRKNAPAKKQKAKK